MSAAGLLTMMSSQLSESYQFGRNLPINQTVRLLLGEDYVHIHWEVADDLLL